MCTVAFGEKKQVNSVFEPTIVHLITWQCGLPRPFWSLDSNLCLVTSERLTIEMFATETAAVCELERKVFSSPVDQNQHYQHGKAGGRLCVIGGS